MVLNYVKLYLLTLLAFLVIDMVWLVVVARKFYQQQLGDLLRPDPQWFAAGLFYLLFVAGLLVFVILPALEGGGSARKVLVLGALFGLVTYATYDLTNLATLKNWPWRMTIIDLAWGSCLSMLVGYAGWWAGQWLNLATPIAKV